ncbi:MAG: DUF2809 domain-containing protein [Calothrix sp. MO_192.B10]|nr:DUF2809 domain-containing protein [Calothrix sp. MO_192.B10]
MSSPSKRYLQWLRYRIAILASIVVIVPLGYGIRFSSWLGSPWLHDALGSLAYEIFWILLVTLFIPKKPVLWIAVGVCLFTCVIEFLQLWQTPFLQMLRSTLPGRLILGNSFTWLDFPPYFFGSFLGWLWVRSLHFYFAPKCDRNLRKSV